MCGFLCLLSMHWLLDSTVSCMFNIYWMKSKVINSFSRWENHLPTGKSTCYLIGGAIYIDSPAAATHIILISTSITPPDPTTSLNLRFWHLAIGYISCIPVLLPSMPSVAQRSEIPCRQNIVYESMQTFASHCRQ